MWLAALLMAAALSLGAGGEPADEPAIMAYESRGPVLREVTATAYTSGPESTGKRPGHPLYGLTATGTQAQEGVTIAVDPRDIPLGSLVYVDELNGYRVAEDTGGAIRGRKIDLYMDRVDDALRWGTRRVRIQVFPKI